MLNNKDFIAQVATIIKMKTKTDVDVKLERKYRRWKFVEAPYSTAVRFAASRDQPSTIISDKRTNKNPSFKISEAQAPYLSPWNDVTDDNKSRWYKTKPERELDVTCLWVIGPFNDRFTAALEYQTFCLLKKSSLYDKCVAHELYMMLKQIGVQMKNAPFLGNTLLRW